MLMQVVSNGLLIPDDEMVGTRRLRKNSNHDRAEGKPYYSM
jgi:hypothetical protein